MLYHKRSFRSESLTKKICQQQTAYDSHQDVSEKPDRARNELCLNTCWNIMENLRMGAFVIDCLHTAGAINNVWIFPGYWMKFFKA